MKRLIGLGVVASLLAGAVHAQPRPRMERDVAKQREAVEAWTACIADENVEEVSEVLVLDFRTGPYGEKMKALAKMRVSERCFDAMPRSYRKIELGGLPFAGGLAERLIETAPEPLLNRLSYAAIGKAPQTYTYTDEVASCVVRGAPNLAADLFATDINSEEETAALGAIDPVMKICTSQGTPIEASPLATRSMLATAAFRVLAAQGKVVPSAEPETAFVECLKAKKPGMIATIRDASGEDAFLAALKKGAEICPTKVEGMSMGKLFKALNAEKKQGNTDA